MALSGPSAGETTRTASRAGSSVSRSASATTKAIKSTSQSSFGNTNEETAKEEGGSTGAQKTTTPKSEVLLTRLLNNSSNNTAEKLTQDAAADQAKWAEMARESALAPFKYQGAMANAQAIGAGINAAAGLGGALASAFAKKKGGGGESSEAGGRKGRRAGGAPGGCANGQCGKTASTTDPSGSQDVASVTGTKQTEAVAKATQADAQWGKVGAESKAASFTPSSLAEVEKSKETISAERAPQSEAMALKVSPTEPLQDTNLGQLADSQTENLSQDLQQQSQEELQEQQQEVQIAEVLEEEDYANA